MGRPPQLREGAGRGCAVARDRVFSHILALTLFVPIHRTTPTNPVSSSHRSKFLSATNAPIPDPLLERPPIIIGKFGCTYEAQPQHLPAGGQLRLAHGPEERQRRPDAHFRETPRSPLQKEGKVSFKI